MKAIETIKRALRPEFLWLVFFPVLAVMGHAFTACANRSFSTEPAAEVSAPVTYTVCDAGDPDVITNYPIVIQETFCARIRTCCEGFDAGTFDDDKCTGVFYASGGFMQTYAPYASGAVSTGNLLYDPLAAARCFDDLNALACQNATAAYFRQTRQDCWSAMNGIVPLGGACTTAFECAPGLYCAAGACARILVLGEACTTNYACTYQQNGLGPSAWCDFDGGTCAGQKITGAACGVDRECQSGHCVLEVCADSDPGVNWALCHYLAYPGTP